MINIYLRSTLVLTLTRENLEQINELDDYRKLFNINYHFSQYLPFISNNTSEDEDSSVYFLSDKVYISYKDTNKEDVYGLIPDLFLGQRDRIWLVKLRHKGITYSRISKILPTIEDLQCIYDELCFENGIQKVALADYVNYIPSFSYKYSNIQTFFLDITPEGVKFYR